MAGLALDTGDVPLGHATLNPFVIVPDAAGLIEFVVEVFGTTENVGARTPTPDGRLIHAEVQLGASTLLLADPQDGWPAHPGMLQVWVSDAQAVLDRATARGAVVVTPPVPFYGERTLARMRDPWDDLWWLFAPAPGQPDPEPVWKGGSGEVFRTVDAEMRRRAG